jgi:hypothetical protein
LRANTEFIDEMKNNNTTMKTKSDMKILSEWLHGDNELRAVEDIPSAELDQYLARFFLSVRNEHIATKYVIIRDYYMTFSILALVSARDSHIKPDSEAGGLHFNILEYILNNLKRNN